MPIDVPDVEALIALLRSDPELRRKVFVAIVPDEFLALPAKVDRLTEEFIASRQASEERFARIEAALERQAQEFAAYRQASEERFARIEAALQALTESHNRLAQEFAAYRQASEERFARIEATIQALTESHQALIQSHNRLVEEFAAYRESTEARLLRIEEQLLHLTETVDRLLEWQKMRDVHIDDLRGWRLEMHYAKQIHAYLGKVTRRVRLLSPPDIEEQVRDVLTLDEVVDLFSADIIARGRPLGTPDREVYLVMEVSMVVDVSDVARARRRAELMRKAGLSCIPAVGGQSITDEARFEAEHSHVLAALDSNLLGWEKAQEGTSSTHQ